MEHLDPSSSGSKNGADIALSIDALELVFTQDHIDAFCILSGDSDFLPLVRKLKTYNKRVYIVAGTLFTNENLRRNCHEFISYEKLCGHPSAKPSPGRQAPTAPDELRVQPVADAASAVRRAIREMRERGEISYTRQIKTTLLRLDPEFDERRFGFDAFKDMIIRLVNDGYFRRQPIGNGHFYIAEIEDPPDSPVDSRPSHAPGGHLWEPPKSEADHRSLDSRIRRGAPARERIATKAGRAAATIRRAVSTIEARGRVAELDLLYSTILDADPQFQSYGCSSSEFRSFIGQLATQGHFKLKMRSGTWVVEDGNAASDRRRESADTGEDEAAVDADGERSPEEALEILCAALRDNAELFGVGLQRSGLRAAVRNARIGFDVREYGVRSFRDLLGRACQKGYLETEFPSHSAR